MLVPVEEYKGKFTTARMSQENGVMYVDVELDIDKLKKEYPFGLPNKVTTHIPISFGMVFLDEVNLDTTEEK